MPEAITALLRRKGDDLVAAQPREPRLIVQATNRMQDGGTNLIYNYCYFQYNVDTLAFKPLVTMARENSSLTAHDFNYPEVIISLKYTQQQSREDRRGRVLRGTSSRTTRVHQAQNIRALRSGKIANTIFCATRLIDLGIRR